MNTKFMFRPLVIFLLVIILAMSVYIYLDYNFDEEAENVPSYFDKNFKMEEINDVISVIKDYSYDNNLALKESVKSWDIDTIKYIGYLEKDKNIQYYRIRGTYSCRENNKNCVFVYKNDIVSEGVYNYESFIKVHKNNDSYKLLDVSFNIETVSLIKNEDDGGIGGTNYSLDELTVEYKNYLINNGYVLKNDLNELVVDIKFMGKNNDQLVFLAVNTFSCVSGAYNCLYDFNNDSKTGVVSYTLIMSQGIDGIYRFDSISSIDSIELTATAMELDIEKQNVTRKIVAEKIKEYYLTSGEAISDDLKKFDVNYITYLGNLKNSLDTSVFKATFTYDCNDGTGMCVNSDVKMDPGSKDFTVNIMFEMSVNEEGEYDIVQVYSTLDTDLLKIKNIILN